MGRAYSQHQHVFLGEGHSRAERNMWVTIGLTVAMMLLEIGGGTWFGSIALVADGFHMSTHAGALLMAASAYALARRWAHDPRFTFGTGKFGDLAGFSSALVLAMIALEIGWEAAGRLFSPKPIAFAEALPIAALGLVVNLVSAWLLSRSGGHEHSHVEDHGGHTHSHDGLDRDHNFRAAFLHIVADAAVSALVIVGLTLAYAFGWLFMDPLAALVGAFVIASWSYQLIRDTGRVLLDMNPDGNVDESARAAVEREGDTLTDLHLWRLGPGHLGAIVSIETAGGRDCGYYRRVLEGVAPFSHLTVEVVAVKEAAPRREAAPAT
jgi:cation diffusion facilitator family transporter